MLQHSAKCSVLNLHAFQIGTFGTEVTTRPIQDAPLRRPRWPGNPFKDYSYGDSHAQRSRTARTGGHSDSPQSTTRRRMDGTARRAMAKVGLAAPVNRLPRQKAVPRCSLRARGGSSPCSPCSPPRGGCAWLRAGPVPAPSGAALALRCAPQPPGGVGARNAPRHRPRLRQVEQGTGQEAPFFACHGSHRVTA